MRSQQNSLRFGRLAAAAVVVCVMAGPLHAQPSRDEALAARRAAHRAAVATFLDRKLPDDTRLKAASSMSYPGTETILAFLELGATRTQSDAIRFEALRRVRWGPQYRDTVLKILSDPADGGEELDANLIEDLARKTAFILPLEDQQRIQAVERKLLDDKRAKVRRYAYRALVGNHDTVALSRLVDALRRGRDVPVPIPDAIDMLHDDGSASYIGVLRPYLDHADPNARAGAARALALDPESRRKIIQLATDPASPAVVRENALRGLAREDEGFAKYAIPIVENERESPEVRYAAMHHLTGRMNYATVDPADQVRFAEAVLKIAGDSGLLRTAPGAKTKDAAVRLHEYLKEHFPEIRKFYEKR